ncbi:hypothetical protein M9H77_31083 [Catharanthus roseus]|uniref:Uncharacterized protein n=1 Tax=Catharanthus roseus TaxID=4058 RepID=A0ACC0A2Z8_CATRO|nr:hypothetical protein M9H77_31083 [Catharanthus roseus]
MKNPVNASSSKCLENLTWGPSKLVTSFNEYFINSSIPKNVDIDETSRIDVDVQDIGTLIHESGKLESVEIHERNSIGDEDNNNEMKKRSNGSPMMRRKKNRKSFNRKEKGSHGDVYWSGYDIYNSTISFYFSETSTGLAITFTPPILTFVPRGISASSATISTSLTSASVPRKMSASPTTTSITPALASIPLGMFASQPTTSTPSATLTPLSQLPYSSWAPISIPSSSSLVGTLLRPAPS